MQLFRAPKDSFGGVDADTCAALIAAASDIAFVVDAQGVILDMAIPRIELNQELPGAGRWVGQNWSDIVTEDSRAKVDSILAEAASAGTSRWRQLNHPSTTAAGIPILYVAMRLQDRGAFVAVGRDMRGLAALQQRLVEAQMSMERDYSRLRHAETRYHVLFQTSSEPVLVIDAATDKVVEANPAAGRLFGDPLGRVLGRGFPDGLDSESEVRLKTMAAAVRAGANTEDVRVRLKGRADELTVSTIMFRQGADTFYLMRFTPVQVSAALPAAPTAQTKLATFIRKSTDGYVVIDEDGRVQSANPAFLQMAQVMTEDQARGELLERWFGRSGVDVNVLLANVRQHGSVTLFSTLVRGEYGATADVEISAVALDDSERVTFGLSIRNVGRRIARPAASAHVPRSVAQLKELIGRVSLKDMVRESTDVIERLCIEAALELTGDNRASAAEMLGLSRQSLYVKLRRYGLAEAAEVETGS